MTCGTYLSTPLTSQPMQPDGGSVAYSPYSVHYTAFFAVEQFCLENIHSAEIQAQSYRSRLQVCLVLAVGDVFI